MNAPDSTSATSKKRVVIIGGGYAGLSTAILLGRQSEHFDVTLIDQSDTYLSAIQLHRTVHTPLQKLQTNYQLLSYKFNFRFVRAELKFDRSLLPLWAASSSLPVPGAGADAGRLEFDFLCVCTGSGSLPIENNTDPALIGSHVFPLDYLKRHSLDQSLAALLERARNATPAEPARITVVGGGATGIQFLFELDDHLKSKSQSYVLQLVDLEPRVLNVLSPDFHKYVARRMDERGIQYYPGVRFRKQEGDVLIGDRSADQSELRLGSDMTLLFPGVVARPFPMRTNKYGQVEVGGSVLSNVLAAGDCAHFDASGMNAPAAQAAVRKGRLLAENIKRLETGDRLQPYTYPELGYFLSMGPWDGIGWMLVRFNVLTGIAAFGIKEAIELQFRLFLEGVDTYVDLI